MLLGTVRFMKKVWLISVILLTCSHPGCAIYGPSLARTDASVALRACQEANFAQGQEITKAMQSGSPAQILRVLDDALREWRATPAASALYTVRAFCIHELVPSHLPPSLDPTTKLSPTTEVRRFQELGVTYFFYDPDAAWVLRDNPVDLNQLATQHPDSPWGRQAFLMMTQLGWSQGACQEGSDQFREVIKRGERFLKDYPQSEVSDNIRLELAHAYATWWNLSRGEPNPPYSTPETYQVGADAAKHRAIELYTEYLSRQKTFEKDVRIRLKALQGNPKGSNKYDYFCPDYED
jgi:hypothetical protein